MIGIQSPSKSNDYDFIGDGSEVRHEVGPTVKGPGRIFPEKMTHN